MQTAPQSDKVSGPQSLDRLNSWKEIAAFFDKDVRTMYRWEAERSLPVHRVPGRARGSVFAYVVELEIWLHENERPAATPNTAVPASGPVPPDAEMPKLIAVTHSRRTESGRMTYFAHRYGLASLTLTALLCVVALSLWSTHQHKANSRRAVSADFTPGDKPSTNAAAQELYLRGLYFWNLRTEASLTQAVALFTQSTVLDPRFSPAYAGLADSYMLLREYGHMTDSEAFPRALGASLKALALDGSSARAHRTYAFLLTYWLWNFPAADREFRRAIALDPGDAQTYHWYATSLYSAGRFQDALKEIDIARRLHPGSISILADRGLLLGSVDPNAAMAYLQELAKANPSFASIHIYLANIYMRHDNFQGYLNEKSQAAALLDDRPASAVQRLAQSELTRQGSQAMFRALAQGYGKLVDQGYPDAMIPSYFSVRAGQTEHAFHYLTLSCSRHEAYFLSINQDPGFRPLYSNSRFQSLVLSRNTPLAPGQTLPACSPAPSRASARILHN